MIKIKINDTTFEIPEEQMAQLLWNFIPPFMRDAKMTAPDTNGDLIRGALKGLWVTMGNKVMFSVYGKNAPKPEKREDKLPYMWACFIDFIVLQLLRREVVLLADETDDDTTYRVTGATALPVPATRQRALAQSAGDGCADCEEKATGSPSNRSGSPVTAS